MVDQYEIIGDIGNGKLYLIYNGYILHHCCRIVWKSVKNSQENWWQNPSLEGIKLRKDEWKGKVIAGLRGEYPPWS